MGPVPSRAHGPRMSRADLQQTLLKMTAKNPAAPFFKGLKGENTTHWRREIECLARRWDLDVKHDGEVAYQHTMEAARTHLDDILAADPGAFYADDGFMSISAVVTALNNVYNTPRIRRTNTGEFCALRQGRTPIDKFLKT